MIYKSHGVLITFNLAGKKKNNENQNDVWSRQRGKIALAGGRFGAAKYSQLERPQELLVSYGI